MQPRLYILMRTDLDSLTPGKAMAQAAHAANAAQTALEALPWGSKRRTAFNDWKNQTIQGFGTTIVLAEKDPNVIEEAVLMAREHGLFADVIHDPTYPITDGAVCHAIPLNTCGYVFVPNPDTHPVGAIMKEFPLHP